MPLVYILFGMWLSTKVFAMTAQNYEKTLQYHHELEVKQEVFEMAARELFWRLYNEGRLHDFMTGQYHLSPGDTAYVDFQKLAEMSKAHQIQQQHFPVLPAAA